MKWVYIIYICSKALTAAECDINTAMGVVVPIVGETIADCTVAGAKVMAHVQSPLFERKDVQVITRCRAMTSEQAFDLQDLVRQLNSGELI